MIKGKFEQLDKYSTEELAAWTLAGYTGYGDERKTFLGSRYYDVQRVVNEVLGNSIIKPAERTDTAALEKAVKATYSSAADELISLIRKETK